jgi:NTP pyrophosphatase (non-canonical NTP hydrolase)
VSQDKRSLKYLTLRIREFVEERGWERYQKPGSLAVSASIEIGELLELFQWLDDEEIDGYLKDEQYRLKLASELADVMIYILRLADVAGIDPSDAILKKMNENEKKYPSDEWHSRIPSKTKEPQ